MSDPAGPPPASTASARAGAATVGAESFAVGWRILLRVRPKLRVLEVSGDSGARGAALAAAGAEVTRLRHRRVEAATTLGPADATWVDGDYHHQELFPVPFDAAVVSLDGVRGPELRRILAAVFRALIPGGVAVISAPNPLFAWPGARSLRAAVRGSTQPPAPGWPTARALARLGPGSPRREIAAAGFGEIRMFAPLPAAERPKFLVPLGEPAVLDYFFSHLAPRPQTRFNRALVGGAQLLARAGLFEWIVPDFEVVATKPGAEPAR